LRWAPPAGTGAKFRPEGRPRLGIHGAGRRRLVGACRHSNRLGDDCPNPALGSTLEIGDGSVGLAIGTMPQDAKEILLKFRDSNVGANTTIAVIATDAVLTKAGAKRLAISA
jgi:L-aminopeptidase/D-esterase-like protein